MVGILDEVGWVQSVLVNERTGYMLDGGLRRDVAVRRKQALVPVVYIDVTEEEELLILATFDPITALAEADDDALDALRTAVHSDNAALQALLDGRAGDDLTDIRRAQEINELPDSTPETVTREGDIWVCGDHRLMCGDSTDEAQVRRLFGEQRAKWLWTDPPYGVDYEGGTSKRMKIVNDQAEAIPGLLSMAFAVTDQFLEPGATLYVAHPAGSLSLVFGTAFVEAGWHLHQTLVWLKDSMVLGHSDYQYRHEPILYGWKGAKHQWNGGRNQTSVLEFPRPKRSADLPTQKVVELVEAQLRNSSLPGDLGYDPFAGSGTTLIAAHRLGRRCYAMELSPQYADVVVRRWERHAGQQAVLEASGESFAQVKEARRGR